MRGFPSSPVLDAATATDFQVCALFAYSTPFHDSATLSNNVHRSPLVHCFDDILPKSTFLNESGAKKRNFLFFARVFSGSYHSPNWRGTVKAPLLRNSCTAGRRGDLLPCSQTLVIISATLQFSFLFFLYGGGLLSRRWYSWWYSSLKSPVV